MKLGTRARYSVRMMMAIAKLSASRRPVALRDAAAQCGLSRRYLDQLVPPLRNAGLLKGRINRRICLYLEQYTLADLLAEDWPARVKEEMAKLG